jgi:tRNA(Ser,Leu) C12 N-acetylase TAN1
MKLTDVVDRKKIDLKKPKKIIKVEIIGKDAGISLLTPDELLVVS